MTQSAAAIESVKKLSPKERWAEEIDMAEQELKTFHERGNKVTRRFLDERDMMEAQNKWFNVFYTNTNIMESALYAQLPKPKVSRRFKDYDDDVARVAALIIERSITQDLDDPKDTFDSTMRHCVQDRLIPGLASAWLRLETDTAEIPYTDPTEDGSQPDAPKDYDMKSIVDQRVCVDYVFWKDFIWSPCRIWKERRWTGRKVYMDRDALIKRFGEKKGKQIQLDYTPSKAGTNYQGSEPKHEVLKKACIYEIWDRTTRKVLWISRAYPEILDEKQDPLGLASFEPCPEPMFANVTTSNCVPRPDYYMVQDQYTELDTLNNRISMLLQACKVVGTYDKSAEGISRMLNEGFDNQLIPVDNWAAFAEKGGLKGTIDWLPLDVVVAAITQLVQNREIVKAQIYELTGISDIVRGATKASETLGAQEIKSKFASIAIKKRQDQVARFAAEILRIKAELMVKHFDPEILIKKSNIEATGVANQQFVQQAMQMLQSEEGFEWRIQVTADSIAQADYAMEKADRIEFLTMATGFIEKSGAMIAAKPDSAPLLINLLKWGISGFRNTAEIEGMLDQELDKMQKQPPQPKGPSPEEIKAKAEQQKMQGQMQLAQQKGQLDIQGKQMDMQIEVQRNQAELQQQERMNQMELMMQERMNQMDMQLEEMKFQFEVRKLELDEERARMEFDNDKANALLQQRTQVMSARLNVQTQREQAKIKTQATKH